MSEELKSLQIELWKVYQTIKAINTVAAERELDEEEKEKLQFFLQQYKSIKLEITEETSKNET